MTRPKGSRSTAKPCCVGPKIVWGPPSRFEQLASKSQEELFALLLEASRTHQQQASRTRVEIDERVHKLFAGGGHGGNGRLTSLADWMQDKLRQFPAANWSGWTRRPAQRLLAAYDDRFRPKCGRWSAKFC